ncbi:MAG: hypothetical protein ISS57_09310 [Anaerolineales bacterium]|nr:hypothetical protein [Anaerolineales bacterium]
MARQVKDRLQDFFDPSRSIPLFIIGTAALSLGFQALYDFANEPSVFQGGYVVAFIFLALAIVILFFSSRRKSTIGRIGIMEEYKPMKRKGLILLAGPTEASAPHAIEYHLSDLEYCWIISTPESIHTADKLADRYQKDINLIFWGAPNYIVDPDQIQDTYDLVFRIIEVEAVEKGLNPHQLIADITGGTKPMTTGMGMACLARDLDMEYMKAPRDKEGRIIPGSVAEPIRIDTTYVPSIRPLND